MKVKTYAQVLADNRRAGRMYAALAGKEPMPMDREKEIPAILKPKRVARQLPGESEADIRRSIMSLLNHHPKIHKAWTQGSGNFLFEGANGKKRMFRANSARGMSDIQAILKGSGRGVFIEVKAAKGRVMEHQQEFLDEMTKAGALAFVARSVDDVLDKLEAV